MPGGPLPAIASVLIAAVCLVPFGLAIYGLSPRRACAFGFGFAFVGWLISTRGLATGLSSYLGLTFLHTSLAIAALCAYLALPYALFALVQAAALPRARDVYPLTMAAALAVIVSVFPSPVPIGPAHALAASPAIIQILDLGGQPLLLFVLCLVNWLFVDMVVRRLQRRPVWACAIGLVMIGVAVPAYGYARLAAHRAGGMRGSDARAAAARVLTVAAIQPNVVAPGAHTEITRDVVGALLTMTTEAIREQQDVQLVVWPETPGRFGCDEDAENVERLKLAAGRLKTAFLVNCTQRGSRNEEFNTALFVTPDGEVASSHKQRLFPFAEYVPGERRFPLLRSIMPRAGRYEPGQRDAVFTIDEGSRAFAAICYEALFSDRVRRFVERGGNVLINQANDGWFGNSRVPDFLVAAAVLLAVEHRVPVVRVSNAGDSVFVAPTGELMDARTPRFETATRVARVPVSEARASHAWRANAALYALTVLWACGVLAARAPRPRSILSPQST